jgi:hypothetical protein
MFPDLYFQYEFISKDFRALALSIWQPALHVHGSKVLESYDHIYLRIYVRSNHEHNRRKRIIVSIPMIDHMLAFRARFAVKPFSATSKSGTNPCKHRVLRSLFHYFRCLACLR